VKETWRRDRRHRGPGPRARHPPWPRLPAGSHGPAHLPAWRRTWHRDRRFLFVRLVVLFGLVVVLVLGGMGALAFLLSRLFRAGRHTAGLIWIVGISLSVSLPMLAAAVVRRAFQHVANPLADVMSAAEAVANGDLSVRVPEYGPGEFGRLAASFNRMVVELERADLQRRNLTADVAHELRTPLHIIQGNLEGILDQVYEPTPEHVAATLDETRALVRLVDDLRTLSLAETGQLPLVWEVVDVCELLADVCTSFGGQAEAAGIDLALRIDEAGPVMVGGDVGRLDQVLGNLVSNALRYTPDGGTIALRAETMQEGVRISVSDTGAGIPADDLPFIFDRFWKGNPARTREGGVGSGLGLAIARQLVQAHGGRINVASKPGQGTTFIIELPDRDHGAGERAP
jgi:signal transduction histidine kinase